MCPADGYSTPYITSVVLASALYGFLAIALSTYAVYRIVGNLLGWGDNQCLLSRCGWGRRFSSTCTLHPGRFSHACSAFAAAAFFVLWLHVRRVNGR